MHANEDRPDTPETIPDLPEENVQAGPENPRPRRRLGDLLVETGLIDAEQVTRALDHQRQHGVRLGSALVTLGILSEKDLESSLGKQLGLEVCDVESINPPPEVIRLVPEALIRKYEVVPLAFDGRTLILGMTDPSNVHALDEILFSGKVRKIERRLVTETTFRRFLSTRYATAVLLDQITGDSPMPAANTETEEERRIRAEDADAALPPVVRLANYLLEQAVEQRASDIHIEPYETFFRVRFRVDGCLYTVLTPPQRLQNALVSRIKILAEMDISERRKPQDGHLVMRVRGEELHYRVSTLPTSYGEKCVIRLLKKEAHLADVSRLGFSPEQFAEIKRVTRLSQGLLLITGPTGSGKTTTVHAAVNHINDPEVNIVTIEDPVEATIAGVNHVQVQEKGGVTFPSALRSILRQDPDVVFVGEMRDPEVSQIAVRASLTGHLVLSTLHTNGIIETFGRLLDLGIEPYLLASSLQLVVAQRLVRRLCPKCAEHRPLSVEQVAAFKLTPRQVETAFHRVAVGCKSCLETGYRGRLAVYEMLSPSRALREALRTGDEAAIRSACESSGTVWLWEAGVARALAGETSLDEVRRVLTPPEA